MEKKLVDPELAKTCINKLREIKLIGEWLAELWYHEIFEDRKDYASGQTMEEKGLNVWRVEWIYTAVPISVLEKNNTIVSKTRTKKKIKVDKLEFFAEAYFTLEEED